MEELHIEKTKSTPEVHFDAAASILHIKGQSYPENAFKFYEPIFQWLDGFIENINREIVFEIYFHMPYINTSSSKCVMMLLDKLEHAHAAGKPVRILWYYDKGNEMAFECAEEFREDLKVPFVISAAADEE